MGFIGLLVNIPVNYIFIYGHFGMPELGGVGCGVATASVYWVMFASMLWWVRRARSMRDIRCAERFSRPDFAVLLRLVQLGLPIALALFFEVTLFAVVALLVSPLGIIDVAGHQIALNFSSLMFVLPLSLAAAVTIRVGFRLGQGSTIDAQVSARTGVGVGVCLAVFTAIFTVLMREQIALLYNDNPEVVLLASHLMLLAAIYQISDSIQVIGSGILRGYKDTRSIFYYLYRVLGAGFAERLSAGVDRYGCATHGARRFLVWIYHRPDLRRHHDDAADAFSTAPALQHHLTARRALVPAKPAPPAGFFVLRHCDHVVHSVTPRHQRLTDGTPETHIVWSTAPQWGYSRNQFEDFRMKKVLALVVAAAMGLSSVAFAADAASATPAAAASHTTVHHKKHHKAAAKPAAEQKAQAAKKHHKAAAKPAAEQKAQAAKKHHKAAAKPAVAQKAQAAKKHHKAAAKPAVAQKAQAAKKHHKAAAKPAVAQKAQAAKKHHKAAHHAAKPAVKPAA